MNEPPLTDLQQLTKATIEEWKPTEVCPAGKRFLVRSLKLTPATYSPDLAEDEWVDLLHSIVRRWRHRLEFMEDRIVSDFYRRIGIPQPPS